MNGCYLRERAVNTANDHYGCFVIDILNLRVVVTVAVHSLGFLDKRLGGVLLASTAVRASLPAKVVDRNLPEWAMFGADYCYVRFVALIPDLRIVVPIAVDTLCPFNELLRRELSFSRTFRTTALLVNMITPGVCGNGP